MADETPIKIKTQNNFFDTIGKSWQLIMAFMSLIVAIVGLFYRVDAIEAQNLQNKTDIRSLEIRQNSTEGDIKAIREGIEFIKQRLN